MEKIYKIDFPEIYNTNDERTYNEDKYIELKLDPENIVFLMNKINELRSEVEELKTRLSNV